MYVKEQHRVTKNCFAPTLASTAADVINSSTILNIGSLYRVLCSGSEIFVNPTTVTLTTDKNGIQIPTNGEIWFVANTTRLQTLSTAGTGFLQLTEYKE